MVPTATTFGRLTDGAGKEDEIDALLTPSLCLIYLGACSLRHAQKTPASMIP